MSDRSGLNTSLQDDASRIIRNSFGNGANGGLSTADVFNKPPAQTTDRTVPRVDVQTSNDRSADPERFRSAIKNGVMELTYGDPDFDAIVLKQSIIEFASARSSKFPTCS